MPTGYDVLRVCVVNFKHISHLALVFLLLGLNMSMLTGYDVLHVRLMYIEFGSYVHWGL